MWNYLYSVQDTADVQVIGGDFNAEPDEFAIKYLTGQLSSGVTEQEISVTGELLSNSDVNDLSGDGRSDNTPDFVDVWTATHSADDASGFTFPVCKPVKRIDYIMVRNTSSSSHERTRRWFATVKSAKIVGHEPTLDTGKYR